MPKSRNKRKNKGRNERIKEQKRNITNKENGALRRAVYGAIPAFLSASNKFKLRP